MHILHKENTTSVNKDGEEDEEDDDDDDDGGGGGGDDNETNMKIIVLYGTI